MKGRLVAVAAAVLATLGTGSAASADTIRVQSTTDTVDAGLVDGLLKPTYAQAQPGDTLDVRRRRHRAERSTTRAAASPTSSSPTRRRWSSSS